jgi:hypothetical protein
LVGCFGAKQLRRGQVGFHIVRQPDEEADCIHAGWRRQWRGCPSNCSGTEDSRRSRLLRQIVKERGIVDLAGGAGTPCRKLKEEGGSQRCASGIDDGLPDGAFHRVPIQRILKPNPGRPVENNVFDDPVDFLLDRRRGHAACGAV